MGLLRKLEQKFAPYAVPNLTMGLIAGQVMVYALIFLQPEAGWAERLIMVPQLVLAGEVWRLLTFLLIPPVVNPIFAFFFWYLLYLMGTALEESWGTLRYNLYLLVGYLASVSIAFLVPGAAATNTFLYGTVFLAFAHLFPDFVLHLFLILPVKIKWLALLAWLGYGWAFLSGVASGDWMAPVLVLASVANFFLFFGKDIYRRIGGNYRRTAWKAKQTSSRGKAFHRCEVCGITDQTHPDETFRYCSQCAGAHCYCSLHINQHQHVTSEEPSEERSG